MGLLDALRIVGGLNMRAVRATAGNLSADPMVRTVCRWQLQHPDQVEILCGMVGIYRDIRSRAHGPHAVTISSQLLDILQDRAMHTRDELTGRFGISRSHLQTIVCNLRGLDYQISGEQTPTGYGYRLVSQ